MHAYQGILQSRAQYGGSGSFAPPTVRVPSRSGRGSLGLRPPRGASGSGGAGVVPPRQRGSASSGASGSRGRGACRRQEPPADDDLPPPQIINVLVACMPCSSWPVPVVVKLSWLVFLLVTCNAYYKMLQHT